MKNLSYKQIIFLIILIFVSLLSVLNFDVIIKSINFLLKILLPFIIGLVFAYILNVPMSKIETKILKNVKGKRVISLMIVILAITIIVSGIIYLVIPELYRNIADFATNIPSIAVKYKNELLELSNKYPSLKIDISTIDTNNVKEYITSYFKDIIVGSTKLVSSVIGVIFNVVTGFIFALYILLAKEDIIKNANDILTTFISHKKVTKIKHILDVSNNAFSKFIGGQCLECVILGLMIYITLLILGIPYSLTIALLTTITAVIPIFGSFIAFGVGIILLVLTNPVYALIFAIAFLVIQQIEGNLIYPKVVGNTVGLSPLWTMFAVTVFGSAFGLIGMLISVPFTSIIFVLIKEQVDIKKKRELQ